MDLMDLQWDAVKEDLSSQDGKPVKAAKDNRRFINDVVG